MSIETEDIAGLCTLLPVEDTGWRSRNCERVAAGRPGGGGRSPQRSPAPREARLDAAARWRGRRRCNVPPAAPARWRPTASPGAPCRSAPRPSTAPSASPGRRAPRFARRPRSPRQSAALSLSPGCGASVAGMRVCPRPPDTVPVPCGAPSLLPDRRCRRATSPVEFGSGRGGMTGVRGSPGRRGREGRNHGLGVQREDQADLHGRGPREARDAPRGDPRPGRLRRARLHCLRRRPAFHLPRAARSG